MFLEQARQGSIHVGHASHMQMPIYCMSAMMKANQPHHVMAELIGLSTI
jgi:hypothetical protein